MPAYYACMGQEEVYLTLFCSCREKGGAYGTGVVFSDGIFSFYSFRFVNDIYVNKPS